MTTTGLQKTLVSSLPSVQPESGCMKFNKYYLYIIGAVVVLIIAYMLGVKSCKNKSKKEEKPDAEPDAEPEAEAEPKQKVSKKSKKSKK
jgi:hypothetical protein